MVLHGWDDGFARVGGLSMQEWGDGLFKSRVIVYARVE